MNYIFKLFTALLLLVTLTQCETDGGDTGTNTEGTGTTGSLAKFTIKNNYLYIVEDSELNSINIENKRFNNFKSKYIGSGTETIFAYDTLLLLGSTTGMSIYDISTTPNSPQYASTSTHFYSCDPVIAQDTFAFVTLNSKQNNCFRARNVLQVYSIKDIYNPKLLSETSMDSPLGLAAKGEYLLVADDGIKLFSTASKDSLVLVDYVSTILAHDIIPLKNSWIVIGTDGMKQFEIKNDKLVQISQIVRYEN